MSYYFSLPLHPSSQPRRTRFELGHSSSLDLKRKRQSSPEDSEAAHSSVSVDARASLSASISQEFSAEEAYQRKVAGLGPSDLHSIPRRNQFPHKALPDTLHSNSAESEPTLVTKTRKPKLRRQHLAVLTTILHKCL